MYSEANKTSVGFLNQVESHYFADVSAVQIEKKKKTKNSQMQQRI